MQCKNDPNRKYKGTEPSPKGRGYCAHAEPEYKERKGQDTNIWVVRLDKNNRKSWRRKFRTGSRSISSERIHVPGPKFSKLFKFESRATQLRVNAVANFSTLESITLPGGKPLMYYFRKPRPKIRNLFITVNYGDQKLDKAENSMFKALHVIFPNIKRIEIETHFSLYLNIKDYQHFTKCQHLRELQVPQPFYWEPLTGQIPSLQTIAFNSDPGGQAEGSDVNVEILSSWAPNLHTLRLLGQDEVSHDHVKNYYKYAKAVEYALQ